MTFWFARFFSTIISLARSSFFAIGIFKNLQSGRKWTLKVAFWLFKERSCFRPKVFFSIFIWQLFQTYFADTKCQVKGAVFKAKSILKEVKKEMQTLFLLFNCSKFFLSKLFPKVFLPEWAWLFVLIAAVLFLYCCCCCCCFATLSLLSSVSSTLFWRFWL